MAFSEKKDLVRTIRYLTEPDTTPKLMTHTLRMKTKSIAPCVLGVEQVLSAPHLPVPVYNIELNWSNINYRIRGLASLEERRENTCMIALQSAATS